MWGMATGSWIANVIYDRAGFYATGIAANLVHLCLVAALVLQWRRLSDRPALGRAVRWWWPGRQRLARPFVANHIVSRYCIV